MNTARIVPKWEEVPLLPPGVEGTNPSGLTLVQNQETF